MKSWDEIADPLIFTIRGKAYEIPELGYREMLTVQRVRAGLATEFDQMDAEESWRLVMGSAWDEMVADNVPAEAVARAGLATLAFFESGREAAEAIWENGIDPKALMAVLAARTEPPSQSSTAEASATPSPARMSGTSSPTAGRGKAAKKRATRS